jgi:hypothetical protein
VTLRRKLLMALAFGLGAVALPAALIMFEAANRPRPEMHDAAYVRALLHETRLVWEDQRAMAGSSSTAAGIGLPEPGSGY